MVFATSKGKTADQHCNVETALVQYPLIHEHTIERKMLTAMPPSPPVRTPIPISTK